MDVQWNRPGTAVKDKYELDVCWSHAGSAVVWRCRVLDSAKASEHATIVIHVQDDGKDEVSHSTTSESAFNWMDGILFMSPDALAGFAPSQAERGKSDMPHKLPPGRHHF
jgi:hypothetical protein